MVKTLSGLTNLTVADTLKLKKVSANGSLGTAGQVLHSNGTTTYWAADDEGVTSVATGNGMTGGTITTTGTVSVLANAGIIANATGTYVDQAYAYSWTNTHTWNKHLAIGNNASIDFINTTSANPTSFAAKIIVGVQENVSGDLSGNSYYGISSRNQYTHTGTGSGNVFDFTPYAIVSNTSTGPFGFLIGQYSRAANYGAGNVATLAADYNLSFNYGSGNVATMFGNYGIARHFGSGIVNNFIGQGASPAQIHSTGNVVTSVGLRIYSATANNTGRITGTNYGIYISTQNTSAVNTGALHYNMYSEGSTTFNIFEGSVGIGNTNPTHKLRVDGTTSLAGAVSDITTLAAGNTSITGFANVSTSVNSALLTVGTSFIANTTQLTTTVPFSANGGVGSVGQVLTSNGATGSPYWANPTPSVNVAAQYTWTNSHVFQNTVAITGGLTVNSSLTANGSLGSPGQVLVTSGAGNVYWASVSGLSGGVNTAAQFTWTNSHVFQNTVAITGGLTVNSSLTANGSLGSPGQVLVTAGSGNVYWAAVSALSGGANTAAQYTWTNTHTFQNIITFSSLVNAAAINVTGQVNTATLYATTSANIASAVQANSTGVWTTGTVNAASHTVGTNFIANSTAIVGTGYANVTTSVNSALFTVGNSFTANSTMTNTVSLVVSTNTATIGTAAYFVAGGNVGIGNTAPNAKLQVTGTANVSGNVAFGDNIALNNDKNIYFKTVNTSASVGMRQQPDDNFVFYSTNTAYGQRAVWSIFANSVTSAFSISVPTVFNAGINLGQNSLAANGTTGTAGQVLASNGTATYWVTPGVVSVNTAAQFTWTNTHIFQANVSFTGNGIGIATNTGAIYLGGLADNNWKIGRNTGATTKWRYTNNSIDIITANSNLEGFSIGLISGNTYFETGYLGTFIAANVTIGNSSSNSTINSTGFAFGTSFIANTLGAYHTGVVNAASHTVGTAFTANATVVNAVSYYSGTLLVANTTVINATHLGGTAASGYQTTAGLPSNVATLTSNNSAYLGGTVANSYIKMNDLLQPFNPFIGSTSVSNTVKKTFNSIETNRFLGRGNLIYVTQDTVVNNSIASIITNGNFDETIQIGVAGGAATILNINVVTNGLQGASGFVYSSGAVWVMFYPGMHPSALTCRTKDNVGTWTAATVTQEIFYAGSCIGWKCAVVTNNYLTDIEITITPQASVGNLGLAEIEYHGSRMGISEGPLLTVGGGTLYGSSKYYSNATVNSTVSSTLLQVSNSTSTANLTAADLKIGTTTVVNSTAVVATTITGNLSASYANISGQVNTATLYAATSANIGTAVIANSIGLTTTGFVNAATVVNSAAHTVGTNFIANSTAIVGTGYANVTTSVNSALLTVGTAFIANTTGAYHTGTINAASHTVGTAFTANSTVVNAVSYYSGTLLVANSTVSNATHLGGQLPAYYTNATNITTGTLPYAQIPANVINTTAAFTRTGITTFSANIVLGSSALSSNGGFGSAGEVLHSNGTATYWAADDNTTYDLLTVANVAANEARVRLKDSANANDDILIAGANGITTFSNSTAAYAYAVGSSTVTVNATGIHVNPVLSITDLTVSGNLSVLGDTVTLNVASIAIEDSLVEFARNQDDTATFTDALDIGIYGSYGNTSNSWSTGLFRDQSDSGTWKIFQSNGIVTNTNINTTNSSLYGLAPLRASSFGTTETGYGSAVGGAISNATVVAVGNSTANVIAGYGTFNLNNNLVANSTGVYHTGTVNAASHTVGTNFIANSTAIVGTGFANVTTSVNSALLTVGTNFIANTLGAYHTGTMNAASHTVGTSVVANATGVWTTGTVNAASHTVGPVFIANTTQLTTTVPFSANGSTGTAGFVLTSNGATGSPYWAVAGGAFAIKSSNYTAVSGDRLLCNTAAGTFTITLPATPAIGATVLIYDIASFTTNPLTIARNSSTIESVADDFSLDIGQTRNEFIYDGSTWHVYSSIGPRGLSGTSAPSSAAYSIALG